MPTVGTITYSIMTGVPDLPAEQVEELNRRGRDYSRWRKTGLRSLPAEIRCVAFVAIGSLVAAISDAKALSGQTVDIVDAHTVTWTACKIERVSIESVARTITNGTAVRRMVVVFQVRMGDPAGGDEEEEE